MSIRLPTAESYALKVPLEQTLLPLLAPYLSVRIPKPLRMGIPSRTYPYHFSIYEWLEGTHITSPSTKEMEQPALDLAVFLKEFYKASGPSPGQHNWWRGDHLSFYDEGFRHQIRDLSGIIDTQKAVELWERACKTRWSRSAVWVHGDFATGNMLFQNKKLSSVINFGGMADPAFDLVIAWTFALDKDTWLLGQGWALWKATLELCEAKSEQEASRQKNIIEDLVSKWIS